MELQSTSKAVAIDPAVLQRAFLARVYRWMFLGLGLTAFTAYFVANTPALMEPLLAMRGLRMGLWLGQLLMVFALAGTASRLPGKAAVALFLFYAALNGVSFSVLFFVYDLGSATQAFVLAAGIFGGMSVYGMVTQKDLSSWSSFLIMGLFGVVLASVVNIFLQSSAMSFVVSCASVLVFTGLAAYDTQKLKALALQVEGDVTAESMSVVGALELYLDFINLFLALLRLTGRRR